MKITAQQTKSAKNRIAQGDIFQDIEILENLQIVESVITLEKIWFPYIVCLNQECDLETDYITNREKDCDKNFLHLLITPAFNFEEFITGTHWGEDIYIGSTPISRKFLNFYKNNEIPRYHYLKFPDNNMPELIIDFKHSFTINKKVLYQSLDKRLCSLEVLFRERINQRFSNYLSRIGLPEMDCD